MQNHKDTPHRTIAMPESRAKQVALAAAYCDTTGETFIQSAITAALLALAENDKAFAYLLARAAGVEWDTLERANRADVLQHLAP